MPLGCGLQSGHAADSRHDVADARGACPQWRQRRRRRREHHERAPLSAARSMLPAPARLALPPAPPADDGGCGGVPGRGPPRLQRVTGTDGPPWGAAVPGGGARGAAIGGGHPRAPVANPMAAAAVAIATAATRPLLSVCQWRTSRMLMTALAWGATTAVCSVPLGNIAG